MTKKYLWNNTSINQAVDCKIYGECYGNKIIFDSRDTAKNNIFVALKGERTDGHYYLKDVLSKGGGAAVVDHIPENLEEKDRIIKVNDTLDAIRNMAVFNRGRTKSRVIGITGSVGKTSTKETVHHMLRNLCKVFCTSKNYNGQIGIPMAVASMPIDVECSVYEMGMSFAGEMTKITKIVRPDIAIITNISGVHLENFNSVEDIARAKAEIFNGMSGDGVVLLNKDNEYTPILIDCAKKQGIKSIYTFGSSAGSDAHLESYSVKNGQSIIKANICGEIVECKVPLCGEHQAFNILVALLLAKKLSINIQEASHALKDLGQLKGRGKVQELECDKKKFVLVDESYNASPVSMESSLKSFNELCGTNKAIKRKVAVLGDMYELGVNEKDLHRGLLDPVKFNKIDKVITVGSLMKELFSVLPKQLRISHFKDHKELTSSIKDLINDGDAILIKGSNGTKLHEVVKYLES